MSLKSEFRKEGGMLFRYRGQIPAVLFLIAVPVIFITPYEQYSPLFTRIVSLVSISISIAGFLLRCWVVGTTPARTSGRNTKEQEAGTLNTKGIYSAVRHPLYFFNFIIWIGIVLFTMNFWLVIIVSLMFWIYYERIMFAEEHFLEIKFGQQFLEWSQKTPAFFPSFKNYEPSTLPFSLITVLRREYSGFLALVASFVFVSVIRCYSMTQQWEWKKGYTVMLVSALVITLLLRTLKHQTSILESPDRS